MKKGKMNLKSVEGGAAAKAAAGIVYASIYTWGVRLHCPTPMLITAQKTAAE